MTQIWSKLALSSQAYGLMRGILYNYDRKDKYNKQLMYTDKVLYTLTSGIIIFPFFILPCLYSDSKNIELFLRNKKELMTQDLISASIYDTHEVRKFYVKDEEYNHN
jgi:hypothetical protein